MKQRRGSGVLLHISSLPSRFGVGDMGPGAYEFADFLFSARQSFWQILPLNPTMPAWDNSPYMSLSAFAGNPLFVSPELLMQNDILCGADLDDQPHFPGDRVNYPQALAYKEKLLERAWQRFKVKSGKADYRWETFCMENIFWLGDFALFMALRDHFREVNWTEWPRGIRDRRPDDMQEAGKKLAEKIAMEKFRQYIFYDQWMSLKRYCNDRGILIMGDMPIYLSHDSADVWSHPELFQLNKKKMPAVVAGVPPDYFSETGQLWGNPLYRWEMLKKTGYGWMIRRIAHNLRLFDYLRIDHFRGYVSYWEVPATETTAINGKWVSAPGFDFFEHLAGKFPYLPIICEDMGAPGPKLREVMCRFGFPGMRVLLSAFGKEFPASRHTPHHHTTNCVVYTGTHDNNTIKGWFTKEATPQNRRRLTRYLGKRISLKELHWDIIRLAMMSVGSIAIFPMQDLLGLGEDARMNLPGTSAGNWEWRLQHEQLMPSLSRRLLKMTKMYGRSGA